MSEEKAEYMTEYMNSPVDELKRYRYCNLDENCLAFVWIEDTEQGIKFRVPRTASTKILDSLNTRAESPDSAISISEFLAKFKNDKEAMEAIEKGREWVKEKYSPPPPVAAEGLIAETQLRIAGIEKSIKSERGRAEKYAPDSEAREILLDIAESKECELQYFKKLLSTLQHQDGVLVRTSDLQSCYTHALNDCNTEFPFLKRIKQSLERKNGQ